MVNSINCLRLQRTKTSNEQVFVDRPDLVEESYRLRPQSSFRRTDQHFGRIKRFVKLGRNGRHNSNDAVTIGKVILNNWRGASLLNLCAHCRIKIDQIDLASPWID